jgi:hypothetical protein
MKKPTIERRDRPLILIAGVLGVWLTVGVGLFLLVREVASPVFPWIVVVGVLLAVYIEVYWVYAALQSGLYRERARDWPEGSGKVPPPSNHQGGNQVTNLDSTDCD